MDTASAFCPSVLVPLIATDDFTNTVFDVAIVLANAHFGADYFQNFNVFRTAFTAGGVATSRLLTDENAY